METEKSTPQRPYTMTKTFSFSKDNLDVLDTIVEQDNQSEYVCDAIRFYIENNEGNQDEVYKDKITELENKIKTQELFIDLLKDQLNLGGNVQNKENDDEKNEEEDEAEEKLSATEIALKSKKDIIGLIK